MKSIIHTYIYCLLFPITKYINNWKCWFLFLGVYCCNWYRIKFQYFSKSGEQSLIAIRKYLRPWWSHLHIWLETGLCNASVTIVRLQLFIGYAAIGNYMLPKCVLKVPRIPKLISHYAINSSPSSITGIKYRFIEIRSNSYALWSP